MAVVNKGWESHLLILDPWFEFCAKQAGRDKLLRTVQYFGKYVEHRLLTQPQPDKELAKWIKGLTSHVSYARKLFRLGKFLESWVIAFRNACDTKMPDFEKYMNFLKNFTTGLYYWYDSIQWIDHVKLVEGIDRKHVDRQRNVWWAWRIIFTLICLYLKLQANEKAAAKAAADDKKTMSSLQAKRTDLYLEVIRNVFDIPAPALGLGYGPFNNGHVGIFGTISSLLGVRAEWPSPKSK